MENKKLNAFIKYLEKQGEQPKKEDIANYDNKLFYFDNEDYFVLTDEEADELTREEITNCLWAFNTNFILNNSKLEYTDEVFNALKKLQQELCEDANELIKAIINDLDDFVEEAVSCDGRGHFLSYYDGVESEIDGFYIYKR